jgi:hypothetical protein
MSGKPSSARETSRRVSSLASWSSVPLPNMTRIGAAWYVKLCIGLILRTSGLRGYAAAASCSAPAFTRERFANKIIPPAASAARPMETNIGREL